MRQGQQNRRGRGRHNNNNNNNRGKSHQNPLTRSFESSGPDVKLRGTPSHIAEKYMSLARDAHSSGDPVLAENYLQHAEHYNRIIMAVREQQMAQGGGDPQGGMIRPQRHVQPGDPVDGEDFDDDGDDAGNSDQPMVRGSEPQPPVRSAGYEQPRFGGERHERHERSEQRQERHERGDRGDRGERSDRGERVDRGERNDRAERGERYGGDRQDRGPRFDRPHREQRENREPRPFPERQPPQPPVEVSAGGSADAIPRRRERFVSAPSEQPEFLRRPVRRPRREGAAEDGDAPAPVTTNGDDGQG
jgi:hypothetical protein